MRTSISIYGSLNITCILMQIILSKNSRSIVTQFKGLLSNVFLYYGTSSRNRSEIGNAYCSDPVCSSFLTICHAGQRDRHICFESFNIQILQLLIDPDQNQTKTKFSPIFSGYRWCELLSNIWIATYSSFPKKTNISILLQSVLFTADKTAIDFS